jgi:hypothetical protein
MMGWICSSDYENKERINHFGGESEDRGIFEDNIKMNMWETGSDCGRLN